MISKSVTLKLEIINFIIKHIEDNDIKLNRIKTSKLNEFVNPIIERCLTERDAELKKQSEILLRLLSKKTGDKIMFDELKNLKPALERDLKPIIEKIFNKDNITNNDKLKPPLDQLNNNDNKKYQFTQRKNFRANQESSNKRNTSRSNSKNPVHVEESGSTFVST